MNRRQFILLAILIASSQYRCGSEEKKPTEPAYTLSKGNREVNLNEAFSAVSSAVPIGKKNTIPVLADLAATIFSQIHDGEDFVSSIGNRLYGRDIELEIRIINDLFEHRKVLSDSMSFDRPIIYLDRSLTPAQFFGQFFKQIGSLYHGAGEGLAVIADAHLAASYLAAKHPEFLRPNDSENMLMQLMMDYLSYLSDQVPDSFTKRNYLVYFDTQKTLHELKKLFRGEDYKDLKEQVEYFTKIDPIISAKLELAVRKDYSKGSKYFASIVVVPFTERTAEYIVSLNQNMPKDKRELLEAKMEALRDKFGIPETKNPTI